MSPPTSLIRVETDGAATALLTLNRPEKRNALSIGLVEALCAAIETEERNAGRRILIIRGAGPAFCAGMDLAEAADPGQADRSAEGIARALGLLSGSRLVTVAAVHGAAIGGGAGLMGACDFAVAEASAKIGYPEPRRGLVAGLVMTFLRRQLKERDAREILLGGELFTAERALEMGLVNRVAPAGASLEEARKFAASVLEGGPRAVEATKRLFAELWPNSVRDDLDRALAAHLGARRSPEAKEGAAAFFERRPPRWPAS